MQKTWKCHFFKRFIPLSIVVFVTIAVFCYIETNLQIKSIVNLASATVRDENNSFQKMISDSASDVLFLKEQTLKELYDYHQSVSPNFIKHLSSTFETFSAQHGNYDQIRFLDQNGDEVVKINNRDGQVTIVPQNELKNRKDQNYFTRTMERNNNEIYFSPLDLNIENKQLIYPFHPTIRIASPLFSKQGKKLGIIILNYNAKELIDRLKHNERAMPGHLFLIDQEGYFLLAPNPEHVWGSMLPSRKDITVAKLYPTFWRKLIQTPASEIYTKKGVFFVVDMTSALPTLKFSDLNLKLFWLGTWRELIPNSTLYYLIILFLLLGASFFVSWTWTLLKIKQAEHENDLEFLATIDSLTKIANRRELFRVGTLEFDRAKRFKKPFSVLMIDLDFFKNINDTYGHLIGDKALVAVAAAMNAAVRKIDFVSRFGGEEFVIILPETQIGSAKILAEKLRQQIATIEVPYNGSHYSFTVSIGVSTWNERDPNIDSVINRADANLYKAKEAGRNRVVAED